MKYEITKRGVYGVDGKVLEIGAEIEVKGDDMPGWLVNKAVPVKGGKTAITNPAKDPLPEDEAPVGPFAVGEKSPGWYAIKDASGNEVGKALRKDDADAFETLSDEDKTAFAAEHAKG
jgi:hypothetical protein